MEAKHTPGPWAWRKVGKDYVLWGDHGHRPIVLDGKSLRVRNFDRCVMVPLEDDHPDARLIAAAPDLLAALERLFIWRQTKIPLDLLEQVEQAIAKAKGGA